MSLLDKIKSKASSFGSKSDLARSREIEQNEVDDETYDLYFSHRERRKSIDTVQSDCTFDNQVSSRLEKRRNSIATPHCMIFPGAPRRAKVSFFDKVRKKVTRTPSGQLSPNI